MKIEANLVNQICDILREKIINLELKLGQRIDIKKLAEEFEVSQTPIREALNKLIKDGLVTINPRRGYYVVKLLAKDMEEIYDLRKMFESYALESGIKNIEVNKLRKLKQKMIEQLQGEVTKQRRKVKFETDKKLHLLIIQSSYNKKLKEMYSQIYNFVKISQRMNPRFKKSLEEHIALIDAILEKDLEKAKKLLMLHIDNARDRGIKALESNLYKERERKEAILSY